MKLKLILITFLMGFNLLKANWQAPEPISYSLEEAIKQFDFKYVYKNLPKSMDQEDLNYYKRLSNVMVEIASKMYKSKRVDGNDIQCAVVGAVSGLSALMLIYLKDRYMHLPTAVYNFYEKNKGENLDLTLSKCKYTSKEGKTVSILNAIRGLKNLENITDIVMFPSIVALGVGSFSFFSQAWNGYYKEQRLKNALAIKQLIDNIEVDDKI